MTAATPARVGNRAAAGKPRLSDELVAWGLVLLLAWVPLPLGSNRPWSWSLLAGMVSALLVVWALGGLLAPWGTRLARPVALAAVAGLAAWLWGWVQTVPLRDLPWLPPAWAHPAWTAVAGRGFDATPTIGMDPHAGREGLMRLLAYAGVFWLGYALGQERRRARRLFVLLIVIITGYAVFGLAEASGLVAGNAPQRRALDVVTATFVNRNHFATYANLGLVLGLALLLAPLGGMRDDPRLRAWAERAVALLEGRSVLLVGLAVMLAASLLTASRGGALSLVVAVLVLVGIVLARARPGRLVLAVVAALTILGGVTAVELLGGHRAVDRLAALDSLDHDVDLGGGGRLAVWGVALRLIGERPLLGHGLGSFESAFDQQRDERFTYSYSKAHNTYLELAVELGVPAAGLLGLAVLALVVLCARGCARRRHGFAFPLAGVAATVLVGLHALVDFSLQIPAVAVTYAAILGTACGQSLPTPAGRRPARPAQRGDQERVE